MVSSGSRPQELLDVAARKFFERGYTATSIQELADEMGLLKGSLYHYISSKEELLYEIISRVHSEFQQELERCREVQAEPIVRIREYVRRYTLYVLNNAIAVGIFYQDARHLRKEHYEHIVSMRDQRERFLVDLLEEGQSAGQVRAEVNAKLAALSIFGSMNWTYRWYRPAGEFDPDTIADEFANQAVASVAHPRPPQPPVAEPQVTDSRAAGPTG